MKIALINTPYLFAYGKISTGHNCSFPMGLGYIAAYARKFGHEVIIFDPEAYRTPLDKLLEEIKNFSPDIIGITCVTSTFMLAKQLAEDIKKQIGCYLIMGGPHVNALPRSSLESIPSLDAIILGEGEVPVLAIADYFDKNDSVDFNQIPGAAFYEDGDYKRIPNPKIIENIDELPCPARDLLDLDLYRLHAHFQRGKKSATVLTSRGCPSKCTYCANLLFKRRFRPRSAQKIIEELESLVNDYSIKHFHFVDDCFSFDMHRVEEICDLIIERRLDITWFIFGRVDTLLDERIIKKMKKAGCLYILLGIETGNQKINEIMKKETTLEQAEECCKLLRRNKINFFNSFIIGNEGETEETIMETIAFAKKLKSVMAGFNILIPFPGTHIFRKYFKDYDHPDTDWNNWCSVGDDIPYEPRQTILSKSDILRLTSYSYRKYYLSPRQLWRIIRFANNPRIFYHYLKGAYGLGRQVFSWIKKSKGGQ